MNDHKIIYLEPLCHVGGDGRQWCEDDVWTGEIDRCDQDVDVCDCAATSYTRTSILEAERAAAQERERELLAVIADYADRFTPETHPALIDRIQDKHAAIIAEARAAKGGV